MEKIIILFLLIIIVTGCQDTDKDVDLIKNKTTPQLEEKIDEKAEVEVIDSEKEGLKTYDQQNVKNKTSQINKTQIDKKHKKLVAGSEVILYQEKDTEELNIQFPPAVSQLDEGIVVVWLTKDPNRIYASMVGDQTKNFILNEFDYVIEDISVKGLDDNILLIWARQNLIRTNFGPHLDAKRIVVQLFDKQGKSLTKILSVDERQDVIDMVDKGKVSDMRTMLAKKGVLGQGSREGQIAVFDDVATIVWQDDRGQIFKREFKAQDFISDANPIGEKYPKDKELEFVQFNPSISIDGEGKKLVVWQELPDWRGNPENAPNGFPNYGVRIDENNIIHAKDIRIDRAKLPEIPDFPGVLGLSEGWLVSWKESSANNKYEERPEDVHELMEKIDAKLYVGFLDKDGKQRGEKIRIDTSGKVFEASGQTKAGDFGRRAWYAAVPGMDKDNDNDIFIVWTDYRNEKAQIYGRYIGKDGEFLTDEIFVGEGFSARVVYKDGKFYVFWYVIKDPAKVTMKSYAVEMSDFHQSLNGGF